MKNDISLKMLERLNTEILIELGPPTPPANKFSSHQSPLMKSLMGSSPSESPIEIEKLKSALSLLSPDVDRGQGKFYTSLGFPTQDYWLAAVWAIASLGWVTGKDIAKNWSEQCSERYTDEGFEKAWNDFKPNHPNPIGIGSLYKRAMQLGWQKAQPTEPTPATGLYKLLSGNDLRVLPPVKWRLKGVFPYKGLAALYGPSASGKSFLALDLSIALSEGNNWFGIRTTQSKVIYVALEGESGFKNRVAAWELENQRPLPSNMFMVMQPFQITNSSNVDELAGTVPHDSVLIVDTLNRAAPTSDENSSKEMGEILQACKRLQGLIGGLVVLVHHTGKDTTKGARGHSSLFAALDGAVEVNRLVNSRSWSIAKAKDGEDGKDFSFELKVHNLGKDLDGDEITSCTIEQALPNIFVKPPPQGAKQQSAFKALKGHIATLVNPPLGIAGGPGGVACMKFEDAVIFLAGTLATTAKNKRTNEARRLLKGLSSSGHIDTGLDLTADTWCWVSI
jgi:hypothetical protein